MFERQPCIEVNEKTIRQLLVSGLDEMEVRRMAQHALARELYRQRHITIGLAAELAGVQRAEFLAELAAYNIPVLDLPQAEVEREFTTVDAMMGNKEQP